MVHQSKSFIFTGMHGSPQDLMHFECVQLCVQALDGTVVFTLMSANQQFCTFFFATVSESNSQLKRNETKLEF